MQDLFRLARLDAEHNLSGFVCGVPELDRWLADLAHRMALQDITRTWVWTSPDSQDVVAYFSIAPTRIANADLPRSASGGHSEVPGYLIGRLALDRSIQGRGLGRFLLLDALDLIVASSATSGGRLIIVDSIDERAAIFYRRYGFRATRTGPRLFLKVATARKALADPDAVR
ncbi:MAG: hypothetical protein LBR58_11845 [Propionibacteriaceae bacterium]|jgi:ribosomal protein S18 acetylase RimI-like enzyme|nr:hypothetical protein [Propionibacteriaceae bacterium]